MVAAKAEIGLGSTGRTTAVANQRPNTRKTIRPGPFERYKAWQEINKMPYYCYIVECVDGSYYTGWAKDPEKRAHLHNLGRGAAYTRLHRPVRLVYVEEVANIRAALQRERAIKKLTHSQKKKLINPK